MVIGTLNGVRALVNELITILSAQKKLQLSV